MKYQKRSTIDKFKWIWYTFQNDQISKKENRGSFRVMEKLTVLRVQLRYF